MNLFPELTGSTSNSVDAAACPGQTRAHAALLSLLAQERHTPEELRSIARSERYVPMHMLSPAGMDKRQIYQGLPAPLNGYIGIFGAFVGKG